MTRLLIVGAGGHGRSVAEAALATESFALAGFLDDYVTSVWDYPVLGKILDVDTWSFDVDAVVVAIGSNDLRSRLQSRLIELAVPVATVIHPKSIISPTASIGVGSVIMAGAIVGSDSIIGSGVIVNNSVVIDHDCIVEDYAHLGVTAAMAGGARLGRGAWMQAGSVLGYRQRLSHGEILPLGSTLKME